MLSLALWTLGLTALFVLCTGLAILAMVFYSIRKNNVKCNLRFR